MPMTVTYIKNSGVLIKGEGVVTGSEIKEANDKIYDSRENIMKIKYQLCDFLEVSEFLVTHEDIVFHSEQDYKAANINPHMIIAIVASSDLIFGLSRMWEAYSYRSPFQSMVFRSIEDAEKWIDEMIRKP